MRSRNLPLAPAVHRSAHSCNQPMKKPTKPKLSTTGIDGVDTILAGGFPKHRLYHIKGDPGVGKTTLALQFLMAGATKGEKGMYITLSETKDEVLNVAESHGWDLDDIAIFELSALEHQLRHTASRRTAGWRIGSRHQLSFAGAVWHGKIFGCDAVRRRRSEAEKKKWRCFCSKRISGRCSPDPRRWRCRWKNCRKPG